ncbi:MAG TPA: YncE family protein [Hyphomonadaceae bacterium]|nr:YncE family protein [Hyphomonadaceae bacterium]
MNNLGLKVLLSVAAAVAGFAASAGCASADKGPKSLVLEHAITLPKVKGRIDHLAINPEKTRLAVAELGNGSVDVLDIETGAVAHRITGLREPQGLAFSQDGSLLIVAEGGAGDVQVFDAKTFETVAKIPLGEDADNVRIDPRNGHAIVGYASGALGVVDLAARKVVQRIALPAHPEGFQIDPTTGRAFVNLPDAHTIVAVDLDTGTAGDHWSMPANLWNFPMALDPSGKGAAVVFRMAAGLVVFDRDTGAEIGSQPTCGDVDDIFYDPTRSRLYVACGEGAVDVFDIQNGAPRFRARTPTKPGARTALFVPSLDRLFVAARATDGNPDAAILVLVPTP